MLFLFLFLILRIGGTDMTGILPYSYVNALTRGEPEFNLG